MSDDKRDDAAWLLARERGQPGPAISEERVARYQRLEALVAELPATPIAPPVGLQERMRAKLDEASGELADVAATPLREHPAKHRRWVAPAAAAAAAAVALIVVLRARVPSPESPPTEPEIAIRVTPGDPNRSAPTEHAVGDQLIVEVVFRNRRGGELRVYDDEGIAQKICAAPGPGCHIESADDRITLVLSMTVKRRGALQAVLFVPALGRPSAGQEADLADAERAGIKVTPHHQPKYFH